MRSRWPIIAGTLGILLLSVVVVCTHTAERSRRPVPQQEFDQQEIEWNIHFINTVAYDTTQSANPYYCDRPDTQNLAYRGVYKTSRWGNVSQDGVIATLVLVPDVVTWRSGTNFFNETLPEGFGDLFYLYASKSGRIFLEIRRRAGNLEDDLIGLDPWLAEIEQDGSITGDLEEYDDPSHPIFGAYPGGYKGFIRDLGTVDWEEIREGLSPIFEWEPDQEGYVVFNTETLEVLESGCRPRQ